MKDIIRIKSISEVHNLFGFEKPKHPLVSVLPIDERMISFDYGERRYTFDFYEISLKKDMRGHICYGRNSYDFQEGTMVFIKPNQVVKIEKGEHRKREHFKGEYGWALLFHPDLIRKSELGRTIEQYSFFSYDFYEALHLSNEENKSLTELVQKIKKEYNQNIDKHSQDLIIANIEMILKYCKRYYDRQFYTRTNLNKNVISKFEKIMSQYYKSDNPSKQGVLSVKYCANKLNMSSNYFGDMIKNETGINAKDHIHNFIIEKAKDLIINSNKSISEIAYSLGFEHPQSFNKLFKAKTNMSPTRYRSLN